MLKDGIDMDFVVEDGDFVWLKFKCFMFDKIEVLSLKNNIICILYNCIAN